MCKKKQFKYCPSQIDPCLQQAIRVLNAFEMLTLGSCCGHGKYPATIVYVDPLGGTCELFSGKEIPRKKKFYKKDKQGYYYILEVIENDNSG